MPDKHPIPPQLYAQAKREYQEKLAIQQRLDDYYRHQQQKFGLSNLDKVKAYLPEEYHFLALRRNMVIAHLDFEPVLELIAARKEFVVVSGLNPSSQLHLGHKALFDVLVELQQIGGRLHIPLTNDESYLDGKQPSLSVAKTFAYEAIIPSILSLGFDIDKTHLYVLSDYPEIYNFALHISRLVTPEQLDQVFGKESTRNVGQVFYRGAVQLAEILLPQLPEFGGPKPTLIPVGIDQHPYVLLARDVAKKLGLVPPSELVMKFQQSLRDPETKMSGSKPETAIYLDDGAEDVKRKIDRAYTGAVSILDVHRELGGVPEICSVFALLNAHHGDDEFVREVYQRYKSGDLTMGELKQVTTDFLIDVLQKLRVQKLHNKKYRPKKLSATMTL